MHPSTHRFSTVALVVLLLECVGCGPSPDPHPVTAQDQPVTTPPTLLGIPPDGPAPSTRNATGEAEKLAGQGDALGDQGQWEEALTLYRKAADTNPGNEEIRFRLGVCLTQLKRLEEAASEYREAVRLRPKYPEAHNNLGNLLVRLNHLEEAISHFRAALEASPGNPKAHNNLGMALAKLGHVPEAVTEFRESVRLDPQSAEAWLNLANAYMAEHRYTDAVDPLREALRLNPKFVPAQKARVKLEGFLQQSKR